ncbi:YbaN family protein [Bacillus sp. FJAT-27251]|uniref:YbaN family protein n=1 Tax=Bacillus sp. FJAT-27251 TaxID=1684142 RepID=UPI000AEDF7D9|nr:YbaN family protein [Bacillus sp. FJAT-27251]
MKGKNMQEVHVIKKLVNLLYIALGFLFMGLGMLGIVLPVLPTTPLLLLALFFFVKGSKRFEAWFRETKVYKKYLQDFIRDNSMTVKQKVAINLFADSMILIAFIMVDKAYVRAILLAVVLYKWYYFITKIKTIHPPEKN